MTVTAQAVMCRRPEDVSTSEAIHPLPRKDMRLTRTATYLLLAAIASVAHAESPKTREQVKAELQAAIRTGDVYGGGDSGLKMNEMYPQRYPRVAPQTKSRAEVQADLAAARRDGTMVAAGEGLMTLRDEFPQRYPAAAVAPGRAREEVVAETREAIRNGDMVPAGEGGMTLSHEFPQHYARQRMQYAGQRQHPADSSGSAARWQYSDPWSHPGE